MSDFCFALWSVFVHSGMKLRGSSQSKTCRTKVWSQAFYTGIFETDADRRTFRWAVISAALAAISARENWRIARRKTKLSSILMCCLYIETRPAIALLNASAWVDNRFPVARHSCPNSSPRRVEAQPSDARLPAVPDFQSLILRWDCASDAAAETATLTNAVSREFSFHLPSRREILRARLTLYIPPDIRIHDHAALFVAPMAVPSPTRKVAPVGSRISLLLRLYSAVIPCVLFCILHLFPAACSKLP